MRRAKVALVAALAIPLAGCVWSGKPKTVATVPAPPMPAAPAPPREPLSIPQTHVILPAPQPVNPEALVTAPPAEPAPPVQVRPAAPPPSRPAHAQTQPPKPVDPPPPEPSRPPIQEILPADEEKQFQVHAEQRQAAARALLAVAAKGRGHLTAKEKKAMADIDQFLKQSEQAEASKDMRSADQLADRAYILAKELQSGK
jgi:hypothetical protein